MGDVFVRSLFGRTHSDGVWRWCLRSEGRCFRKRVSSNRLWECNPNSREPESPGCGNDSQSVVHPIGDLGELVLYDISCRRQRVGPSRGISRVNDVPDCWAKPNMHAAHLLQMTRHGFCRHMIALSWITLPQVSLGRLLLHRFAQASVWDVVSPILFLQGLVKFGDEHPLDLVLGRAQERLECGRLLPETVSPTGIGCHAAHPAPVCVRVPLMKHDDSPPSIRHHPVRLVCPDT